jgi:YidC/Oxa1 family membrane protein insertase
MGLVAYVFGYVLKLFFNLLGNYGWAVILFSLVVKGIMIPFTIKQQKQMKKSQELQPKLQALQEKYKDDQQKLSVEYQKFLKENKYSPFSGCFTMILQFIFLIGVFYVVSRPITYMEKLDVDTINSNLKVAISNEQYSGDTEQFAAFMDNFVAEHSGDDMFVKATKDISVNEENYNEKAYLAYYKTTNRYYEIQVLKGMYSNGELDFFGINLAEITMQNVKNIKLWVFPILTVIFYYLSLWMMSRRQKSAQKMKDADGNEIQMPNMMAMNFTMPLLSGWISVSVPQGMALYWFINSFLQVIIQLISEKVIKKEEQAKKDTVVVEAKAEEVESTEEAASSETNDDPVESDKKSKQNNTGKNKNSSKKKKKK